MGAVMGALSEALRQRGYRLTIQREIILDAFESLSGHVTAEDVHARVRDAFPQINVSTVYRTLELLEEERLALHTRYHDGLVKWHRAEETGHQHLVCRRCNAEQELGLELLDPVFRRLLAEHGFEVDRGHVVLVGLCASCRGET